MSNGGNTSVAQIPLKPKLLETLHKEAEEKGFLTFAEYGRSIINNRNNHVPSHSQSSTTPTNQTLIYLFSAVIIILLAILIGVWG